jgi:GH15 family glucan-1,4-alpha-glucosidase
VERVSARIDDHALIGDGRSAALVARDGTVDWLCWPAFDSPALFAGLLDPHGGAFSIVPAGRFQARRRYLPGTNVLETCLAARDAQVVVVDCMPMLDDPPARELVPERELLRIVRCERGDVELAVTVDARPAFGRARRSWRDAGELGFHLRSGRELLALRSEPALRADGDGVLRGRVRLRAGEVARFSLTHALDAPAVLPPLGERAEAALAATVRVWRAWSRRVRYHGPFRDAVVRSALVLKLLAHSATGAIVAAPTTSLPERLGGPLNWDYRYCWLRDASLTVRALFGLGFGEEGGAFLGWLLHTTRLTRPALRVLYDVYGREPAREVELPLAGYRDSRPVRVGNAAMGQLQLDVYGEVVDAAAQLVGQGLRLDRETSGMLRALGDFVCRRWREPDEGIWEPRGGRRHHTHSKVLCWVALDRLLRMHRAGHLPRADVARYERERQALRDAIERHGWSDRLRSYTQVFDGDEVDAALLQLAWYGYASAGSPRMRSTFARVEAELGAGRGLLRRYRTSPELREGAFGICGFWAAEYLALGGGTAEDALARIEALLGHANEVGLFAEETDPETGDALGNFPQAFTHIGLVNACLTVEERLTGREHLAHRRWLPASSPPDHPLAPEGVERAGGGAETAGAP